MTAKELISLVLGRNSPVLAQFPFQNLGPDSQTPENKIVSVPSPSHSSLFSLRRWRRRRSRDRPLPMTRRSSPVSLSRLFSLPTASPPSSGPSLWSALRFGHSLSFLRVRLCLVFLIFSEILGAGEGFAAAGERANDRVHPGVAGVCWC